MLCKGNGPPVCNMLYKGEDLLCMCVVQCMVLLCVYCIKEMIDVCCARRMVILCVYVV